MKHFRRADGVTSEPSGDRVIVLDKEGSTITTLNPTGAIAWQSLTEPTDADGVAAALGQRFPDVEAAVLREDAQAFLDELVAAGLVVAVDADG